MNKLEQKLEESYDDLEIVDSMYNYLTQRKQDEIDYCIKKRQLICDRIANIKQELKLDEQYGKTDEIEENPMAIFFLSNVDAVHKIDKIRYKKDTASRTTNGIGDLCL